MFENIAVKALCAMEVFVGVSKESNPRKLLLTNQPEDPEAAIQHN